MRPIAFFPPGSSAPNLPTYDAAYLRVIVEPFILAYQNSGADLVKLLRCRKGAVLFNMLAAMLSRDSRCPDPVYVAACLRFLFKTLVCDGGQLMTLNADLLEIVSHNGGSLALLVPGCQTDPLIENRVLLGIEVAAFVDSPIEVFLSGGHPKGRVVHISDESELMERVFRSQASSDLGSHWESRIHLHLDPHAASTLENIENFESFVQSRDDISGVLIASSSFHLPRLRKTLRLCRSMPVTLFGSEDIDSPAEVALHPKYARSACFEVLRSKEFRELLLNQLSLGRRRAHALRNRILHILQALRTIASRRDGLL